MGFKRLVTLVCDGPCGTALPEQDKAPVGWSKVMITRYESLKDGEKPKHPPISGWYCPKCWPRIIEMLTRDGFALNNAEAKEHL